MRKHGRQWPLFKYVGNQNKYPGAIILQTTLWSSGALALPPFIFIGQRMGESDDIKSHEYGHLLQYTILSFLVLNLLLGYLLYLAIIGLPSIISAYIAYQNSTYFHQNLYTEKSANQLSYWMQGRPNLWNFISYPVYWK